MLMPGKFGIALSVGMGGCTIMLAYGGAIGTFAVSERFTHSLGVALGINGLGSESKDQTPSTLGVAAGGFAGRANGLVYGIGSVGSVTYVCVCGSS